MLVKVTDGSSNELKIMVDYDLGGEESNALLNSLFWFCTHVIYFVQH